MEAVGAFYVEEKVVRGEVRSDIPVEMWFFDLFGVFPRLYEVYSLALSWNYLWDLQIGELYR